MKTVAKYFEAKRVAEIQISKLIRANGIGYKNGSIVDHGKAGYLVPASVNSQIKEIRAKVETQKPW